MKDLAVNHDAGVSLGTGTLSPSLLLRLREHDPQAWRRMTDLYGPSVNRWCLKAGLHTEDAADVGQEVFRAVARKLAEFRRDRPGDSFGAWLRTITRNKLLDYWRKQEKQPRAAGGTSVRQRLEEVPEVLDPSSDGQAPPNESVEVLRRALGQIQGEFTEKTWRAFWLVTVEGNAPAEVGQELGMKPGAVYIAKCRILKRFRDEFQDLLDLGR